MGRADPLKVRHSPYVLPRQLTASPGVMERADPLEVRHSPYVLPRQLWLSTSKSVSINM